MNTLMRFLATVLVAWLVFPLSVACGRTWTNTEGKQIEAEWVGLADGKVHLKRADGRVVSVPLEKLSPEDQEFARQQGAAQGAAAQAPPAQAPAPQEAPADVAARPPRAAPQTGAFTISAKEGIPAELFAKAVLAAGGTLKPGAADDIRSEKTKGIANNDKSDPSWHVYVPASYDGSLPYGVLAYINSGDGGDVVGGWNEVLDQHRIIWVGADKSGNEQSTAMRYALAIDGVRRIRQQYQIDPQRIYLSGNSGGGRVCSQLMLLCADLFTGGFPHVGCNPYRNLQLPDNKFMASHMQVSPKLMKQAAKQNRYVLLTGEKDFNRDQTRLIFSQYKSDGFQHVSYLEVPGMEHAAPNAEWFEKGIVALDAPLAAGANASFTSATKNEKGGQLGAALEGYGRAAVHGGQQPFAAEALAKCQALRQQYDDELAKAEELVKAGDATAAKPALAQLRRRWTKRAEDDAKRLDAALKPSRGKQPKTME